MRRPDGMAVRASLAAEHSRLADVPAEGAPGRAVRHRRRTGAGAQRRDLHGGRGAVAGRRPRQAERARHGRLDRRGRRPDPGRPPDRRCVWQRRPHRPRRRLPRRTGLRLRRTRLPGGDRQGACAGGVGPGARLAARSARADRQGPVRRRGPGARGGQGRAAARGPGARHRDRVGHQPVRPGGGGDRRRALAGRRAPVRSAARGALRARQARFHQAGAGRSRGPRAERRAWWEPPR